MPASPLSRIPHQVRLVEVGPRDGLQNEPGFVPTETKVAFIEALAEAGFPVIEASSFVRHDRVPQLGDAEEIFARIKRLKGTRYVALVPNPKGLERALASGVTDIAVFTAASETFNQRNINRTIEQSLRDIRAVVDRAKAAGMWVRGYVSTAFGCPYEGRIEERRAHQVVDALLALGVDEVSIGDTIGVATPADIVRVMGPLLERVSPSRLALHLHDTRGTALANLLTGLELGITTFDSSAGGLGGCPYAPGASGNVASEDVLYLLHGLSVKTGVSPERVAGAAAIAARALGVKLPSRVHQAPVWPR